MKLPNLHRILVGQLVVLWMATHAGIVPAENIDPDQLDQQYAWSENTGWINAEPLGDGGPGAQVTDYALTGYLWGENSGWISLSCGNTASCTTSPYGVFNDGIGTLSGHAWSENLGWIRFDPPHGGVAIDACGDFNGHAWSENAGWISFRSENPPHRVRSVWASPVDTIAPETSPASVLPDWFTGNTTISLLATDCGSGVQTISYAVDGGPAQTVENSGVDVPVLGDGVHALQFYGTDVDGNVEQTREIIIRIDSVPPVIDILSPANHASYFINSPLSANYTVTDATSGVDLVLATVLNGLPIDTSIAGDYLFEVFATDFAGNYSGAQHGYSIRYPGNMDPDGDGAHYAWSENLGWINFRPAWGPGVTVSDSAVTGMAWSENAGWINLQPAHGGIVNDGTGRLSGYAWGENTGWINFACEIPDGCTELEYGVSVNPGTGEFSGMAWGENTGWLRFDDRPQTNIRLVTAWAPLHDEDADGIPDTTDNCPLASNPVQADADSDGIGDACDNCQLYANADQRDSNSDGFGNRCDADFNDDLYVDGADLDLMGQVFYSQDPHADINGDARVNSLDLGLFGQLYAQPPGPSGLLP